MKQQTTPKTRVSFSSAFTTTLRECGTIEVYYQGQLIGDIHNTDDRAIIVE